MGQVTFILSFFHIDPRRQKQQRWAEIELNYSFPYPQSIFSPIHISSNKLSRIESTKLLHLYIYKANDQNAVMTETTGGYEAHCGLLTSSIRGWDQQTTSLSPSPCSHAQFQLCPLPTDHKPHTPVHVPTSGCWLATAPLFRCPLPHDSVAMPPWQLVEPPVSSAELKGRWAKDRDLCSPSLSLSFGI